VVVFLFTSWPRRFSRYLRRGLLGIVERRVLLHNDILTIWIFTENLYSFLSRDCLHADVVKKCGKMAPRLHKSFFVKWEKELTDRVFVNNRKAGSNSLV
jgi:hypothetical protein